MNTHGSKVGYKILIFTPTHLNARGAYGASDDGAVCSDVDGWLDVDACVSCFTDCILFLSCSDTSSKTDPKIRPIT